MPLVIPENVHLVQMDALSHTAGITLSYEMSRIIIKKVQNPELFYDKAISQNRKSHGKSRSGA